MKKILFSLLAMLISLSALAGSDIKVLQGDKKFFKNAKGTAVIEVLSEGATYDKKEPIKSKYSDIDKDV